MANQKIKDFLVSEKFLNWAKESALFLNLEGDPAENVGKCIAFLANWISNQIEDKQTLINLITTIFEFDETKAETFLEYINRLYLPYVKKLWEEEKRTEPSIEEREKRYLELIKTLVNVPQPLQTSPTIKKEIPKLTTQIKTTPLTSLSQIQEKTLSQKNIKTENTYQETTAPLSRPSEKKKEISQKEKVTDIPDDIPEEKKRTILVIPQEEEIPSLTINFEEKEKEELSLPQGIIITEKEEKKEEEKNVLDLSDL